MTHPPLFLPELGKRQQGKVRDIYEQKDTLTLIASDRISIFDRILKEPICDKGRILTELALFWFEKTKDIIPNHILSHPDPNVLIVKKCSPIQIEVIVRGYLTGSLWRDYAKGMRKKCGIALPDGLNRNDPLPNVIVTPTTKSDIHDEDISKEEILERKIVDRELWEKIEKTALSLYFRGVELLKERGMILVDTKYEFGLDANHQLLLIDEIHTPDSSRFWFMKDLEKKEIHFPDKEFLREWARDKGFTGVGPLIAIPQEIQEKVRLGYMEVYQTITGEIFHKEMNIFPHRMLSNLKRANVIKGMCALIMMGSEKDKSYADQMVSVFDREGIHSLVEIASAHKHPRRVLEIIESYNDSLEPVVCMTIAGRSNALSGVMASNLKWPVIACPFFKDGSDYLINIHSSLQMPSLVPVLTVIDPVNAAMAAVRIFKCMERP